MKTPEKITIRGNQHDCPKMVGKLAVGTIVQLGRRVLAAAWGHDGDPHPRPIAVVIGR